MQGLSNVLTQPIKHDIRRITDGALLKAVQEVGETVFGHPLDGLTERMAWEMTHSPDSISLYGAYVDDMLVASARINYPLNSQFAGLWGGGTLEAYRGKGVYTALVAARVQEALQRGRRFLTLDASPMSRPIVEKLGFVPICTSIPCTWHVHKTNTDTN
jgi:GNAT superfamily N-acetyltransferase